MTENPEKKKPLIIESSDSSISSDKSSASQKSSNTLPSDRKKELDEVFGPLNSSSSESSSKVPSTSSSVPSTSTSAQEESSSSSQSNDLKISEAGLEEEYKQLNCNNENFYSNDCNKFLLKKELLEREKLEENPEANPYLYPNLNDKEFNIKIATKKEFNDTKYDGTIHDNIKEQADILAKADFELQPHQAFVKNFMSFQTPYNSLLLFHGLGSGKTCSAIGVCEEMRDYLKQMGIYQYNNIIFGVSSVFNKKNTGQKLLKALNKIF
jgi:hypothetical protein